jgi:hypothetical protein
MAACAPAPEVCVDLTFMPRGARSDDVNARPLIASRFVQVQ